MKKSVVIGGILAALVLGGGIWLYSIRDSVGKDATISRSTAIESQQALLDSIPKSDTEQILDGYTGDEFDRFFIANMIAHHQGAVDMAKLAQTNAQHNELKQMADDIISAQTKEINNMIAWQKAWGYPASSGEMMMDHSAMSMMGENETMTIELKSLSGEAFDKKFIELMIEHHESAVAMSRPGFKNAGHQEVKDLTKDVISAQIGEISQMKQWQKDWGY